MPNRRLASSVYSDSFELEGLLDKLPNIECGREQQAARELEAERDAMQEELDALRSAWTSIHRALKEAASTADVLTRIYNDAQRCMDVERKKWIANCTAI
jgi:hypothetical protein